MTKFNKVLSPDKNFHGCLLDEKSLLMCWEPKNIYIYTSIENFVVCNGNGKGIDFPTIWKLFMRICIENQWAVTG